MTVSPDIPDLTPADLKARLERGDALVLLDVREAHEPAIADLPPVGQKFIPMNEVSGRLDELDPNATTVVYCRSGARSAKVVRFLIASGFTDVLNLRGGVLRWRDDIDPSLTHY